MSKIAQNHTDILAAIAAAAKRAGRADVPDLVAVSKVQPDARIRDMLTTGQRIFGENRVQEAAGKWPAFKEQFDDVTLHLIGPLQSNKPRQAMD